jgi:predicted Rossmann fold nucleotide-binding protein DprA/Smf involved in DNA uptake
VISGGARGVDLEAMAAGFEAGGRAIGVLPDSLARNAVSARYREGLMSGRLALASPYEPEARWFAFTAMERNRLIYALSDAALAVSSAADNGGTWAGAIEALDAARVAVYVKANGTVKEGNRKLLARGGRAFPEGPWTDLRSLFASLGPGPTLFDAGGTFQETQSGASAPAPATDPFESALPALMLALSASSGEKDLAQTLGVAQAQAREWLKRACDEGHVRKLHRPVRYVASQQTLPLFGGTVESADESHPGPRA